MIIVVLMERPAALEPADPTVRFLHRPHAVECLSRSGMGFPSVAASFIARAAAVETTSASHRGLASFSASFQ